MRPQEQFAYSPPCLLQPHGITARGRTNCFSGFICSNWHQRRCIFFFCSVVLLSLSTPIVTSLDRLLPPWCLPPGLLHATTAASSLLVLRPAFNMPPAAPRKTASFVRRWSSATLCMPQGLRKSGEAVSDSAQMVSGTTGPRVVLSRPFRAAIYAAPTWYAKAVSSSNPVRPL